MAKSSLTVSVRRNGVRLVMKFCRGCRQTYLVPPGVKDVEAHSCPSNETEAEVELPVRRKKEKKLYPCQARVSPKCQRQSINRFNCPPCLKYLEEHAGLRDVALDCLGHNTAEFC